MKEVLALLLPGLAASLVAPQRVLVIGGNGQTGSRVVRLLEADERYAPVAMVREATQQNIWPFEELGVEWVAGNVESGIMSISSMTLPGTRRGSMSIAAGLDELHIDAVIFAAGAGRARGPLKQVLVDLNGAIQATVAAQESQTVQRFLLLSGINTDVAGTKRSVHSTEFDGPLAAWHKLKAHSEIYLQESHEYGRQLDWSIASPGRLVDDPGTGKITASLIHGEDDLKESLSQGARSAAVQQLPGSHDGRVERLCCSRDNVAQALVHMLGAKNTVGETVTLVDGVVPIADAIASL